MPLIAFGPGSRTETGFPRLSPDLVVEIASPSQGKTEMAAKVRLWLEVGVRMAWLISPDSRQVEVWRAGLTVPVATLDERDELTGDDVVPGFRLPVAQLFGEG